MLTICFVGRPAVPDAVLFFFFFEGQIIDAFIYFLFIFLFVVDFAIH